MLPIEEPMRSLREPAPEQKPPETADAAPDPQEIAKKIAQKFTEAVKSRNYEEISAALAQGADINAGVEESRYQGYRRHGGASYHTYRFATAIFYALDAQDVKLLEFLIAQGADVNHPDGDKNTALTRAVYKDSKSFIKAISAASGFDRHAEGNQAALQAAESIKNNGSVQKEIYKYVKSILSDPWQPVNDETISRVSFDKDGMLEVTDQFNFKAGERIRHIRDFEMNAIQTVSCFFADMPPNARAQLKEAWEALKAAGGGKNVDPREILGVRHIQRSRSKQVQAGS